MQRLNGASIGKCRKTSLPTHAHPLQQTIHIATQTTGAYKSGKRFLWVGGAADFTLVKKDAAFFLAMCLCACLPVCGRRLPLCSRAALCARASACCRALSRCPPPCTCRSAPSAQQHSSWWRQQGAASQGCTTRGWA